MGDKAGLMKSAANLEQYFLALYITLEQEGKEELVTFSPTINLDVYRLGFDPSTERFVTSQRIPTDGTLRVTESGVYGTYYDRPVGWKLTGNGAVQELRKQGQGVAKDPWPPPPPPPPPFDRIAAAAKWWYVHAVGRPPELFMSPLGHSRPRRPRRRPAYVIWSPYPPRMW